MSDQNAPFEQVFQENKEKIFRLSYKYLGNSIDAEDITQETFIRAYKNYDNFRNDSEIFSWLFRIAINLCNEKNRAKRRHKEKNIEIISMDAPGKTDEDKQQIQFADKDDKKIVDHLIIKELQDCIREETAKLPAIYSEVIILKELENYSYEEIAKILDIPLDTVGVRLIRGRKILKENLKNYI
ncbi:MAG: hypothetical protein A3J83_03625 [Elusimicrobia bacterium RIFOXYA2_FULL_40_6]|nr:MAG: hypothetical protein A3J83_03625 [Elusimicrobia bacterium RIFOXYA2_FULL_40_6]